MGFSDGAVRVALKGLNAFENETNFFFPLSFFLSFLFFSFFFFSSSSSSPSPSSSPSLSSSSPSSSACPQKYNFPLFVAPMSSFRWWYLPAWCLEVYISQTGGSCIIHSAFN